jgi:hypothetical protein
MRRERTALARTLAAHLATPSSPGPVLLRRRTQPPGAVMGPWKRTVTRLRIRLPRFDRWACPHEGVHADKGPSDAAVHRRFGREDRGDAMGIGEQARAIALLGRG